MEMPSLEEQDAALKYVMFRPLKRPDTDIKKAAKYISIFIISMSVFCAASYVLLDALGIFSYMPETIVKFRSAHCILFVLFYSAAVIIVGVLIIAKPAVIGAVRLYQHYAHEEVRRRCLFMPTCSEYAILAVKKYGVLIGLIMAANRLFRKCKGNIYRVDYP